MNGLLFVLYMFGLTAFFTDLVVYGSHVSGWFLIVPILLFIVVFGACGCFQLGAAMTDRIAWLFLLILAAISLYLGYHKLGVEETAMIGRVQLGVAGIFVLLSLVRIVKAGGGGAPEHAH